LSPELSRTEPSRPVPTILGPSPSRPGSDLGRDPGFTVSLHSGGPGPPGAAVPGASSTRAGAATPGAAAPLVAGSAAWGAAAWSLSSRAAWGAAAWEDIRL